MSILLARTREPHGPKLFYKSNQARLSTYNKQRSKDLINQLKQKERISALNQEQVYNDEVADQLAQLYAKFIESEPYKKSKLSSLVKAPAQIQMQDETKMKAPTPPSPIPMLEAPPSPPPIEAKKSRSPASSSAGSPLISELKAWQDSDPEERKKFQSMTIPELKKHLDANNVDYPKTGFKKQDFVKLALANTPKVKLEGKGIRIKRRRHVRK